MLLLAVVGLLAAVLAVDCANETLRSRSGGACGGAAGTGVREVDDVDPWAGVVIGVLSPVWAGALPFVGGVVASSTT